MKNLLGLLIVSVFAVICITCSTKKASETNEMKADSTRVADSLMQLETCWCFDSNGNRVACPPGYNCGDTIRN